MQETGNSYSTLDLHSSMKRSVLPSILFSIVLLLSSAFTLKAQQKIGYIDSEFILSKIPEYANINERLNVLSQQWKKELSELETEVTNLDKEFESKSILFTSVKQFITLYVSIVFTIFFNTIIQYTPVTTSILITSLFL